MGARILRNTGFQEFMRYILQLMPQITTDFGLPKTGYPLHVVPGDDGDLRIGLPTSGPRFTDFGDGMIYDNVTGLLWIANVGLCGEPLATNGIPNDLNWYEAIDACEALVYQGMDDWRMPNINELISIFYTNPTGQAIDLDFWKWTYNWYYWSSTTYKYDTLGAWGTEWIYGNTYTITKEESHLLVFPVRGGRINA